MRVLISAYSCEPGKGSEPGVGWNMSRQVAKHHDCWVITRANNRPAIEEALSADRLAPQPRFIYYDLPSWLRWWKRGSRGVQLYYLLWQVGAYLEARAHHRRHGFDLVHHVTFGKYWSPSFMALLRAPFVLGPVGGGESAPLGFWWGMGAKGSLFELVRVIARSLARLDPFVQIMLRRSALILAKTEETRSAIERVARRSSRLFGESALSQSEIELLGAGPASPPGQGVRFVSIGNLFSLKGFHLALRAFARADLPDAEYWVIGDGPQRARLEALVTELGLAGRVTFWGHVPRQDTLRLVKSCDVLVHPSLHDSGGWVCLEAMAARKPVICLRLGGPATQVTPSTGVLVAADSPQQVVADMASAMRRLAMDDAARFAMGSAGARLIATEFCWDVKGAKLSELYCEVARARAPTP